MRRKTHENSFWKIPCMRLKMKSDTANVVGVAIGATIATNILSKHNANSTGFRICPTYRPTEGPETSQLQTCRQEIISS